MLHIVLTIRDIKSNSYFVPQYVKTVGGFIRQLGDDINGNVPAGTLAETMKNHPEDFEVYRLGTWEDETAEYHAEKPTQVCVVSSLKR